MENCVLINVNICIPVYNMKNAICWYVRIYTTGCKVEAIKISKKVVIIIYCEQLCPVLNNLFLHMLHTAF